MESGNKTIEEKKRELAKAYAKYLKANGLKPGEATSIEVEDLVLLSKQIREEELLSLEAQNKRAIDEKLRAEIEDKAAAAERIIAEREEVEREIAKREMIEREMVEREAAKREAAKREAEYRKRFEAERRKNTKRAAKENRTEIKRKGSKIGIPTEPKESRESTKQAFSFEGAIASIMFGIDKIADKIADKVHNLGIRIAFEISRSVYVYTNAKRGIAIAVLSLCALSIAMLAVLDRFTVYEYAYNGKVLGYVDAQEEVTNVLNVASDQLNEVNTETVEGIEFVANDNITFNLVSATSRDTDDADTTVNKLAYMTDIEVEASGVYDGNKLITVVKDEKSAQDLFETVKTVLGKPDKGMEVVSIDFHNKLDIRPIKVLLTSIQSDSAALRQMSEGGEMKLYHLVEETETLSSIAETFGVEESSIYDEDNKNPVSKVNRGEKVCIRKTVEPVSVELVEKGRMKEVIQYKTVRQESADYYIGDEVVGTAGKNGEQIFEGTLTKVDGKVIDRQADSVEILTPAVDEVILVGITKRPKTAPTGHFHNPLNLGTYTITSRFGRRWGRAHEGIDMGARTGTEVHASDGGTIIRASVHGAYGNCVDIDHGNGVISRYGHLSKYACKVGDKVYQGQLIAYVGSTGRSTGPHLHFEIRMNGKVVDPMTKVEDKI